MPIYLYISTYVNIHVYRKIYIHLVSASRLHLCPKPTCNPWEFWSVPAAPEVAKFVLYIGA